MEVTDGALNWLGHNKKKNFFIFLHYFDLHENNSSRVTFQPFFQINKMKEIDRHISLLCAFLRNNDLYDDSLIVICSDHGNDFGIHEDSHREFLYDSTLVVPLIMRNFKDLSKNLFQKQVRLIDIAPSILYALGIVSNNREHHMDGLILNDDFLRSDSELYAYSETCAEKSDEEWRKLRSSYISLRTSQWKLIIDCMDKKSYLFNLASDPKELNNVYDSSKDVANKIIKDLTTIIKKEDIYASPDFKMDENELNKTKQILRSLGYL